MACVLDRLGRQDEAPHGFAQLIIEFQDDQTTSVQMIAVDAREARDRIIDGHGD
jgi:hypothetical protein